MINIKINISNKKILQLSGGALYFTIVISLIIAIILLMFILLSLYYDRNLKFIVIKNKLIRNANSAFLLVEHNAELFNDHRENSMRLNLFDEPHYFINIKKYRWGVYHYFHIKSTYEEFAYNKVAMAGTDIFSYEPVALYLANSGGYLSLSGNTFIKGNCYLPEKGVRAAALDGVGYTRKKLILGDIKVSKNNLFKIIEGTIPLKNNFYNSSDSITDINILSRDSLSRSFLRSTLVVYSNENITLKNIYISGNIFITTTQNIYVYSSAILQDIIIEAQEIHIGEGFRGSLQCYGSKSVFINNNCELRYPSVICLDTENKTSGIVEIGNNTIINGEIIVLGNNKHNRLIIKKRSLIRGQVYCDGTVEFQGKIQGSLYCNKFEMDINNKHYVNHLLNCTIDYSALDSSYAGLNFFSIAGNKLKLIKWLD